MKKRLLTGLLATVVFVMSGCGNSASETENSSTSNAQSNPMVKAVLSYEQRGSSVESSLKGFNCSSITWDIKQVDNTTSIVSATCPLKKSALMNVLQSQQEGARDLLADNKYMAHKSEKFKSNVKTIVDSTDIDITMIFSFDVVNESNGYKVREKRTGTNPLNYTNALITTTLKTSDRQPILIDPNLSASVFDYVTDSAAYAQQVADASFVVLWKQYDNME